jgi:NhaP-type Na+/H+ or K+/H+ antiporter
LLVFAVLLLLGVLLSELADRTVLSTAVLFLVAGFCCGPDLLGYIQVGPKDPSVETLATLALCSILFTDGMHACWPDLRHAWRLPGRALLLGLPLTVLTTAVLARYAAGVPWLEAFALGAVLCPTDPVFASALIGQERVPQRLRDLLNVESGLNDGLALPIVVALLAPLSGRPLEAGRLAWELGLGLVLGIVVPLAFSRLEKTRFFAVGKRHEPLFAFSIGLFLVVLAAHLDANLYIAAFVGGAVLGTERPDLRREFSRFGELVSELLKLGAVLIFGAMISPHFLAEVPPRGYLFAGLALFAARPAALALALFRSGLSAREWFTVAWFGPKGFASIIYGMLILQAGFASSELLFHLIAIVVAASMIAHSSTDVLFAQWFATAEEKESL